MNGSRHLSNQEKRKSLKCEKNPELNLPAFFLLAKKTDLKILYNPIFH
jgi:hypothetical protein